MKITRKITFGYVILILIPVIAFGFHYYTQIYGGLKTQFVESRQKILEQAYANMQIDFSRIQSISRMLQYNSYVTDYLDGVHFTEAESVYSFIKYIQPLFAQSIFANTEIDSLIVYKLRDDVLSIPDYFIDESLRSVETDPFIHTIKPGKGLWVRSQDNIVDSQLIYYQYLYNNQFTEKIGLVEIKINPIIFNKFFEAAAIKEPWQVYFMNTDVTREAPKEDEFEPFIKQLSVSNIDSYLIEHNIVINQLMIKEIDVRVMVLGRMDEVFHSFSNTEIIITFTLVVILIGLSLVYYAMSSSLSKRILRLARHMRKIDDDNIKINIVKTTKTQQKDEIGFLIETYNSMLYRMDELVNNVHRVELLNKEAKYKVLQAQIKPHFLYNTLETIRMLAETNNDQEVADISFWFGKLMRYSLSSDDDVTTLAQEIEMAKFYLQIHKIRLQNRLHYDFEILIESLDIEVPRFILQPLIENSIFHGVSTVIRPVTITITVVETNNNIHIKVKDTGHGMTADRILSIKGMLTKNSSNTKSLSNNGVGLINVNDRIKAFFGEESKIEIESEENNGTTLDVVIVKRRAGI